MQKKIVYAALVAMLIACGVGQAEEAKANVKVGYVDLNRALNEVAEGKKAKASLEADGKAKQQKLEIKQKELRSLKEELDKQRLILSEEARRDKEGKLQQGLVELQRMSAEFERDFSSKETELTKPIGDKLKQVIAELGKTGGYNVILPKEMILYSPEGTDLTDEVIKRYNSGAK